MATAFKILSIIFTGLTLLNWLAFFFFYFVSASSDDVTLGLGIVLSGIGYLLSIITFVLGSISAALASELKVTARTGKIAIMVSIVSSLTILLMYNL